MADGAAAKYGLAGVGVQAKPRIKSGRPYATVPDHEHESVSRVLTD
jgi:hypothetical protein